MTRPLSLFAVAALIVSAVARAADPAEVEQAMGPVQLIEIETGVVVLELPAGAHAVKLAVPPGHYLLQRHLGEKTFARELAIEAGQSKLIEEDGLTLVGRLELVHAAVLDRDSRFTSLVPAIVTGVAALGAVGGGVGFLIWSTRSSDQETQFATTSYVLFAAGGATAVLAGILTAVPLINRWQLAASAAPTRDGAAVALSGAW